MDWETVNGEQPCGLAAVLSHKSAGAVEAIGPRVTLDQPGDHVALSWSPNGGHHFYGDRDHPILCEMAGPAGGKGVLFDGIDTLLGRRKADQLLQPRFVTR